MTLNFKDKIIVLLEQAFIKLSALKGFEAFRNSKTYDILYFAYKKHFEDRLGPLLKKHPELIREGGILDIGANIGFTTKILLNALARHKKTYPLYAFEPDPNIFKRFLENHKKNIDQNKIKAFDLALSDHNGSLTLARSASNLSDNRLITSNELKTWSQNFESFIVQTKRLDEVVENIPIKFIKLDVQGHELQVLRGASRVFLHQPHVFLEWDPKLLKLAGSSPEELIDFFKTKNYSLWKVERQGNLTPFVPNTNASVYFDVLALAPTTPHHFP